MRFDDERAIRVVMRDRILTMKANLAILEKAWHDWMPGRRMSVHPTIKAA